MPATSKRSIRAESRTTKARAPSKVARELVEHARRHANQSVKRDMFERFGISGPSASKALGVRMSHIQRMAKAARTNVPSDNHALAAALWKRRGNGAYEARMLAILVDDPSLVTRKQMDDWARGFDNWGIVDTACFSLFDRADEALVFAAIVRWDKVKDEFVKRAAFALVASIDLHRKDIRHTKLIPFIALAERHATDPRNFVKKGISWALRSCGKRRPALRARVVRAAERMAGSTDAAVRWVGKDVLRDLR